MKVALNKNIKFERIYFLVIVLVFFWMVLQIRLYVIQVQHHDYYMTQSRIQSQKKINLQAKRGNIYDRNHAAMATNLEYYDIGLDLSLVEKKSLIVKVCSRVFHKPAKYYNDQLKTNRDFVFLARKVPREVSRELDKIEDPGLVMIPAYRRYYPYGSYGSQIIGFTDVDDKGLSGIELQYESDLKGNPGWTRMVVDARRRFRYDVDFPGTAPQPGIDITLTIDKDFQTILEDELKAGVLGSNARCGIAVLMDPYSGEILAMGSYPTFNSNDPQESLIAHRRNRAITDVFEPGSTFKVFSAAALLQEGIKKPDDIVYCEQGAFKFHDHIIHDSKSYGWLSFTKVLEHSSNIGMVKLMADIPSLSFYKYLKSFGFGTLTGITLPGESSGLLTHPRDFSGLSKGVISFGQEVGVTALQITNAFSAIINGGILMKPYLISRLSAPDGTIIQENKSEQIRQVISEDLSLLLKKIMYGVVLRGTGKKAFIEEIPVGGKTGTAQKYNKKINSYRKGGYLASFIGFAPYDSPRYVLGVFIDEPSPNHSGGYVAAPIFAGIIKRIYTHTPLQYDEQEPAIKLAEGSAQLPVLTGFTLPAAEELLELRDLSFDSEGKGSVVKKQTMENQNLILHLGETTSIPSKMPDLRGLSLREALRCIDFSKLTVKVDGVGDVHRQSIAPGSSLNRGSTLYLSCSRN